MHLNVRAKLPLILCLFATAGVTGIWAYYGGKPENKMEDQVKPGLDPEHQGGRHYTANLLRRDDFKKTTELSLLRVKELKKEKKRKLPNSMSDVEVTEEMQKAMDEMGGGTKEIYDHKLRFLDELDSCVGGRVQTKGDIYLPLEFVVVEEGVLVGSGLDLSDVKSQLTIEETTLVLDCVLRIHSVLRLDFRTDPIYKLKYSSRPEVAEGIPEAMVATYVRFPIEEDFVYEFINSNGSPEGRKSWRQWVKKD